VTPADLPDDVLLAEFVRRAPSALIPADFALRAMDAARGAVADWRPAPGSDWTKEQLAREFACSTNTVLKRIRLGEFGPPHQPGGPYQEEHANGKGRWWVPDEQVEAYRLARRLRGTASAPALTPIAASPRPGRAGATRVTAIRDSRAHLKVS
jgi:hypothetical protein